MTAALRVVDLVKTRIPERFGLDPIRGIQVLCPMAATGARALIIQQTVLFPIDLVHLRPSG